MVYNKTEIIWQNEQNHDELLNYYKTKHKFTLLKYQLYLVNIF